MKTTKALRRQFKLEQHDAQLQDLKSGQYPTLEDSLIAYLTKLAIHQELCGREAAQMKLLRALL
jgi:hypothetical protein